MIGTMLRRVRGEQGSVGVLVAFAMFVVIGSLMMTWNTARLSVEKMRVQNAADSAALGYCSWQARGMNSVQNVNDEMYVSLSLAKQFLTIANGFEIAAKAFDAASTIPFVGVVMKGLAIASHSIALLLGSVSAIVANYVCKFLLMPAGYFYAYGSCMLGMWGAMQFAAANGADPLGGAGAKFWGVSVGFYTLGLSMPVSTTLTLPLEPKQMSSAPWKCDNKAIEANFKASTWSKFHIFGTGRSWDYKPFVSKKGADGKPLLPGPSVWFAMKNRSRIETLPLDAWAKDFSTKGVRGMPILAIAAAQCITGDVIDHSAAPKKGTTNQRTAGFGAGATAKLVPVTDFFDRIFDAVGSAIGVAIYH